MADIKKQVQEKNLAYGGMALIEGVLMRGHESYAFTVKKPDGTFHKEKHDYKPIGKRIKILGIPMMRGFFGLFENLFLGIKVLNRAAEIAFPDEENEKVSGIGMFFIFLLSFLAALFIFNVIPYFLSSLKINGFALNQNDNPFAYNFVAGIIRLIMFLIYIFAISFINDTKRLFSYHGAEHKTINAYEAKKELTVENVKQHSRFHPRCGSAFTLIVFVITIFVFPFLNVFFNTQAWYNNLPVQFGSFFGDALQKLCHVVSHIVVGMPIVAGISYELLKLSAKFQNNPLVKILIAPGLLMQSLTTNEPDDEMIKSAILSLKLVLGTEDMDMERAVTDEI